MGYINGVEPSLLIVRNDQGVLCYLILVVIIILEDERDVDTGHFNYLVHGGLRGSGM